MVKKHTKPTEDAPEPDADTGSETAQGVGAPSTPEPRPESEAAVPPGGQTQTVPLQLKAAGVPQKFHAEVASLQAQVEAQGLTLADVLDLFEEYGPTVFAILRKLLGKRGTRGGG